MFPSNYLSLFPAFPKNYKVFVAMSFDSKFDNRYSSVIEPALRRVQVNDRSLEPYRVDARTISDSILTEILSGISTSRLVFADVSTIEKIGDKPIRNGNVMYEVGMAHAVRQPEEVLLFRSDDDQVLFDVANVRLNNYAPEDSPDEARERIVNTVINSLKELDLKKNLAIQQAADTLDNPSWMLLVEAQAGKGISHPETRTMGQVLGAASRVASIQRLLNVGAIKTSYLTITPDMYEELKSTEATGNFLSYECTTFGSALFNEGVRRIGLDNPDLANLMETDAKNQDLP